jgi:Homeodomain-like domain
VWRAYIVLATADGCSTAEITRRSGKSKPVVWIWQARFMSEGVEGLMRDKTRSAGKELLLGDTRRTIHQRHDHMGSAGQEGEVGRGAKRQRKDITEKTAVRRNGPGSGPGR